MTISDSHSKSPVSRAIQYLRRAPLPTAAMALGAALLVGCTTANTQDLIGHEWRCARIGSRTLTEGRTPTLLMTAEGKASGFAGVNRWFGTCSIDGPALKFGMLGMTRMAGPPDRMQLEQTYADALAAVTRWSVSSGRLQLSDSNAVVLEFTKAE
jgi:heat shock protein HslJ